MLDLLEKPPISGTKKHRNLHGDFMLPFCHYKYQFFQIESEYMWIFRTKKQFPKKLSGVNGFNGRRQSVSDIDWPSISAETLS
jgi:hypothetical protein